MNDNYNTKDLIWRGRDTYLVIATNLVIFFNSFQLCNYIITKDKWHVAFYSFLIIFLLLVQFTFLRACEKVSKSQAVLIRAYEEFKVELINILYKELGRIKGKK